MNVILTTPTLSNYRHGEFLQYMKNVLQVYEPFDASALSIDAQVNALQSTTDALDAVFQQQLGSEITPELTQLDDRRDKALIGIKTYLESQLYREETDRYHAAENLLDNYRSHGDKIYRFSYQQETAVINAMLHDWSSGQLLTDTQTLGLTPWIDLLTQLNKDFNEKYVKRAQETAPPAEIEAKRAAIREAYSELTQRTLAFSLVAADPTPYQKIIGMLNGLTDDYNNAVTQRLAGRGSDTEGSTSETPTDTPAETPTA